MPLIGSKSGYKSRIAVAKVLSSITGRGVPFLSLKVLREVDGIGPVRANRITAAWAEQKAVREIMVFLHSHGVGTARAVRRSIQITPRVAPIWFRK